ncbi:MAG: FAD-binding protein [Candidatus Thermoplasmatota archaeon]|nr:FAD-binding protein [Candidatus Thermoplasmatota archaeon]
MEAWDILVIGDGPAALRSAAVSAKNGAKTLLISASSLGNGGTVALEGLAAPIQEMNNRGHREDTIKSGFFLCDQDIVSEKTNMAIDEMNHLEKAGVVFSRDAKGLPMTVKGIGHSSPRVIDAGDASVRDVQQVLEEQCMKHGVVRRGDQLPVMLVNTKQKVDGLITLDMVNGRFVAIQTKAVIIADGGFEGIFNGTGIGLGMDLALQSGIPLRDMEFISKTPFGVTNSKLTLSSNMLGYGANLCDTSGNTITAENFVQLCDVTAQSSGAVIDGRDMGDDKVWWQSAFRTVKSSTGVDMNKYTVGLENRVNQTLGGIATDECGRAVIGSWSRWFTGLYAAGDAACSGLNGAGALPGNRLLDALSGGSSSGNHASEWVKDQSFSNTDNLLASLESCETDFSAKFSKEPTDTVQRVGALDTKLLSIAAKFTSSPNSSDELSGMIQELEQAGKLAEAIHLDQQSLIANTNYASLLRIQAGIRLLTASVRASLARNESRGVHQRSDFLEENPELIHHITVDNDANVGTLAVRKGQKDNWILAPQ